MRGFCVLIIHLILNKMDTIGRQDIPEELELKILNIISRNCDKDAIFIDNTYIINNVEELVYDIYSKIILNK